MYLYFKIYISYFSVLVENIMTEVIYKRRDIFGLWFHREKNPLCLETCQVTTAGAEAESSHIDRKEEEGRMDCEYYETSTT